MGKWIVNSLFMIPTLKKIREGTDDIFEVLNENTAYFYPYWHYHPQYEIMLIEKSSGTRYVGDSISTFDDGDITFIGSDIPHLFRNYPEYFDVKSPKRAIATVLYISSNFVNSDLFDLREMIAVKKLLQDSRRGLLIKGESKEEISRRLKKIVQSNGPGRLIDFISLLHYIASEGEYEVLSSVGFTSTLNSHDLSRLNKVFDYLLNNFHRDISLLDVCKVAHMSSAAFCRYFKKRTNKTLITFLNEIRIGNACKLLIENRIMSISEICYECGFNNPTNFNIQFKKLKKLSPQVYRETYNSF
jgi:AraC-like DNA-binding protein